MSKRDTPDEETNDWRAVCGRTARTVRRAGRAQTLPDPYRSLLNSITCVMAGLVPAIHAVAGIPMTGRHSAFFRILLMVRGLR
jgi:hypothetical protein